MAISGWTAAPAAAGFVMTALAPDGTANWQPNMGETATNELNELFTFTASNTLTLIADLSGLGDDWKLLGNTPERSMA